MFRIFGGFEIGGNEDAGVKTLLRSLRRDRVGKISGRGAADGSETEAARGGKRRGDDAILEGKRREADRVILEIKILQPPLLCRDFCEETSGVPPTAVGRRKTFRQRKKFRIAPHIEIALRPSFSRRASAFSAS